MSSDSGSWSIPPKSPILGSDEIHVWRLNLNLSPIRIAKLRELLSADESERAGRFFFDKDRNHFIAARGLLRIVLSRYLEKKPGQIRFRYNEYGKPFLATENGHRGISFNLSHSSGLALLAIAHGREIGVDLERIRPEFAGLQIAQRFFSPGEVSELLKVPKNLQKRAFFNCWTRKEAYIKAKSRGLSLPLDQFAVSLAPGAPPELLKTKYDPREPSRWSLHELLPGPGYVAALAAEGHDCMLKCWQFQEP